MAIKKSLLQVLGFFWFLGGGCWCYFWDESGVKYARNLIHYRAVMFGTFDLLS